MEGIRRIDSWTRIDRAVGGVNACYQSASGWDDVIRGMRVDPGKVQMLRVLDAPARVEDICRTAEALSDFEVCRALWAFRVIGLVRRIDTAPAVAVELEDESLGIIVPED
jgi:hypothetical protein